MGLIEKERFIEWVEKQVKKGNWLQISEVPARTGRQIVYLTSSGQFVVASYDLKGEMVSIGQPMLAPQPTPTMGGPRLDPQAGFMPR